jgi:hypothetical protein
MAHTSKSLYRSFSLIAGIGKLKVDIGEKASRPEMRHVTLAAFGVSTLIFSSSHLKLKLKGNV